jgi:hypothetical protein
MTAPINLTELTATPHRNERVSLMRYDNFVTIRQADLLALITAVEAAQRTINPTCRCDVCTAIREALTPFQP